MKKGLTKTNHLIAGYGLLLGALFACLIPVSTPVRAATGINQTINFQGRLLNSQGATVPDGYYNIQFKIYQDGDGQSVGDTTGSPAGTLKWTEAHINNGGNNGVRVVNGYLSVSLGSINPFGTNIDWNQDTLWLSMNIAGSATGCTSFGTSPCAADGEMVPMQRFTAAPYALNAGKLGGIASSGYVQLAQGLQTDSSNVTSVSINKTGSGNIMDLQSAGASVFTLGNSGAVTFKNSTNSSTAFQIQKATASDTLFTADTNANLVQIGNNTGTDTDTTILVLDSATSDPITNAVNGAQYYNTTSNKFRCYQNSAWMDCIPNSISTVGQIDSQPKSDNGAVINGSTLVLQTADTSKPGLVSTGSQSFAGDKTFTGTVLVKPGASSATAFQVQNTSSFSVMAVDTGINHLKIFDGTANQRYVDIYYDDATSSAVIAASTGTTKIGNGSGDVTINAGAGSAVTISGHASSSWTLDGGDLTIDVTGAGQTLGIGTGANAKTINIGNGTGATAVTVTCGTGTCTFGGTGTDHSTAIGSTTGASATTINSGSSGISLNGNTTVASGKSFTVTSGTTSLTGTTNINTTGTANTTIGSTSGGTITIGKTSGSDLVLQDAQWNITGAGAATFGSLTSNTDITFASSSTNSGAIIKNFTTGSNVNVFDVVVMSSVPDVRTTTAVRDSEVFGVSQSTVASGAIAKIVTSGNFRINVDSGAVAVGDQLVTSTTTGRATVDNNATTGIIGIALSSKASGANGTVDVYVRPVGGQYTPTFRASSTSTTAFQVQNSNGNNFLNIDTSANAVNIGITGSTNISSAIHIADSSAGVQTVTIGSTSSTSSTTIQSGTSGITLDGNTTIAGSHTFNTGTGLVSLNGNVSIATDKTFNQQGTGTFSTGSGDVSLNGNTTVASGKTFTVTDGTATLGGNTNVGGNLDVTGSTALKKGTDFATTGITNDADFGDVSLVRLSGVSAQTITGIANGRNGYLLTIFNGGIATATLNVDDANSAFANRITNGTNSNITLPVGASITLVYDSAGQKWRATASPDLQAAYGSSTSPQITLNSAHGGLVIQDASSPIGADLFTVQSNGGTTKYFNVTSSTVSVNDTLAVTGNITASGTYNTNTFTSTSLQFGGSSGTVSTSSGSLTIQAAGTNSLLLDTGGAGTVSLANGNATTVNVAANNVAHTIHIGDGGTSTTQNITIGSSGAAASAVTINAGSSGGIALNGNTTITGTASATGGISTSGDVSFNSTAANTGAITKDFVTGSAVTTGDVVIMTNIPDIQTTTLARDTRVFGVSKSTVALGGTARVVTGGNFTVNVDSGAVAVGDQLVTSTTAGRATVDNNATTGIIGIALSSKASGANGTVSVYVRPVKGQNNPTFRASSTSPTAFQVQNNNGINFFNLDTSGNNVNIGITGSTSVNSNIHIADSTAGVQTVTIGSTNSTSTTTIQAGSGGIHFNGNAIIDGANQFSTGTGLVSLNGNTVVASGKTFTANGNTLVKTTSASAFQVQNSLNSTVLMVDTSAMQLKVGDGTNYAVIYFDTATNTANYTATGGTVAVGRGAGAISITAGTGGSVNITADAASTWRTTTGTLTLQSGTSSDLILSAGSSLININGSNVVKLGSSAGDPATCTAGAIVYNSVTNRLRGCQGSTLAWTDLGVTTATLQSSYTASTGGTIPEVKLDSTRGGFDIQDSDSSISSILFAVRRTNAAGLGSSILNVDTSNDSVNIGTSVGHSSNPIILVLDNYNNGGADPTGVVGAMYYNGTNGKFRCYDGTWRDCGTGFNEITKTADQAATQNTTNMLNDNKLFFPMAANTNYVVDAWIPIDDSNAVGGQYTFTVPTGAVLNIATSNYNSGTGTTANNYCNITTSGTSCTLSGGTSTYAANFIQVKGFVRNGATAGNFQFQFAQSTPGLVSFPVVKAGAVLNWRTAN